MIAIGDISILRRDTNRTRFFSLSEKKKKGGSITGEKSFPSAVRTQVSVLKGRSNRIENPVKRTSGAFAVKERARCRKKLVVAACRPDQAVKVLITSRRMVSMMLGPTLYTPHPKPNRAPLCCITLGIYSSICRHLAKYRLGGWSFLGPTRGRGVDLAHDTRRMRG